jgi:viroplasmin and RNaseH domain-containing protein
MPEKYYAVKKGRKPGVYQSWAECKAMVDGFPGAVYKSFKTREEAVAFAKAATYTGADAAPKLRNAMKKTIQQEDGAMPSVYAFVDGSYNVATHVYGYGGFLIHDGIKEVLQGSDKDAEMAAMRNVAGEICGSMAAIRKAVELGLPEVTIYYDYMGIEMWATGAWKCNKKGTAAYRDYVASVRNVIVIRFVKVKGHSGIDGNEEADMLAKQAVGNEI